jgi:predicted DNA-binding protein (MmcQ/YjbR family)
MTHKELEEYILSKPGSWLDYPFGDGVAVYKVGSKKTAKMFALIQEGKKPVQVSLKCDPVLAEKLREQYTTVMPGYHLNKKLWNTIIVSGEVEQEYLLSLVDLSYRLVVEGLTKDEQALLANE